MIGAIGGRVKGVQKGFAASGKAHLASRMALQAKREKKSASKSIDEIAASLNQS